VSSIPQRVGGGRALGGLVLFDFLSGGQKQGQRNRLDCQCLLNPSQPV